jgi:hypothetical protein
LIAVLSASLTAGKLVLSSVPNVEIVTFLIIAYTTLFGMKRAMMTVMVFVTTEILIYGFGTWLLGYYLMWPSLVLITAFLHKFMDSEYQWAIISGLYGLGFGLVFAAVESLFYGINYGIAYWVRGIPFDLIHGASNFIVMLLLYKPITRQVAKVKQRFYPEIDRIL